MLPGYVVYHLCNPGTCLQESCCGISNTSGISMSCLRKVGSNTNWSQKTLELEIDKVLGGRLKAPPEVLKLFT